MSAIKEVTTPEQLSRCTKVIQSLRTHLSESEIADFYATMQSQHYHMLFIEHNGEPAAFCGYRFITHFFSGNIIYIDDLGTLPEYRKFGYGSLLLDYVFDLAKEKGLDGVQLDSGHHRYDAHRLYLNKGFQIVSHHFSKKLK